MCVFSFGINISFTIVNVISLIYIVQSCSLFTLITFITYNVYCLFIMFVVTIYIVWLRRWKNDEDLESLTSRRAVESDTSAVCSICLDEYKICDKISQCLCGHEFHWACLLEWMKRSRTCPLCKQTFSQSTNAFFSVTIEPI